MKDQTKEKELEQRIFKMAAELGEKKWLRIKITFFVLCGVIYLIELPVLVNGIGNIDIKTVIGLLAIPIVMVGFVMLISLGALSFIFDNAVKERIEIAKLEGRLFEMRYGKYIDYEDENAKEAKRELESLKKSLKLIIDECRDLELNEEGEETLKDLKTYFKHVENLYL